MNFGLRLELIRQGICASEKLESRQTHFENIVIQPSDTPTFRKVYAPIDGRVFN